MNYPFKARLKHFRNTLQLRKDWSWSNTICSNTLEINGNIYKVIQNRGIQWRLVQRHLLKRDTKPGPTASTINLKNVGCMVSKEQKDNLVLTIVSLSRCREIGSIEGSVWEGLMVDLKLEILSIKNLKKLSHRASECHGCTQQGEMRNTQTRKYFKIIVFNDNIKGRQGKVDTPGITSRPDDMELNRRDLNTHSN